MKPFVEFVGAGPGAPDLIAVRGLRALERADLVLYAGSLVDPALLDACRPGCVRLDSASMSLGEQIDVMSEAALSGKRVVRLHTGDPSLYGATDEQIRALAERGVGASVVPGVSSVFAAAAALGRELTSPGSSQSVVLTRVPGRTPVPESEDAAAFARTGATLVFFLSAGKTEALVRRLTEEGGLPKTTPAAVVFRASWPDERVLRCELGDVPEKVEEAGIGRQALLLVGRVLGETSGASNLYDPAFSHGYRNKLPSEAFFGRCALYAFTDAGLALAKTIAAGLGLPSEIRSTRPGGGEGVERLRGRALEERLAEDWDRFDGLVFVGATGLVVRKIAPLLRGKTVDPAVVVCAENGAHAISLLSGHLGGANRLARRVARVVGGRAVVGTATDLEGLPAFDEAVAQERARLLNADAALSFEAALLEGKTVAFLGPRDVYERRFAASDRIVFVEDPRDVGCGHVVLWDAPDEGLPEGARRLKVQGRAFVLGVGCRRGVPPEDLRRAAERLLAGLGLSEKNVAAVASCSIKADEPAILELAEAWGVPLALHEPSALDAVPVPTPSEKVREKIGSASVCEAACLLSAGWGFSPSPKLLAPKTVFGDVALALAKKPHLFRERRGGGKVVVAGLGSGAPGQITPDAAEALRRCDVAAGYVRYLDLVRARVAGKPLIQSGMRGETERCRAALEAALEGKNVCMVCSGDPGILAMAGLLFELRAASPRFADVPIEVLPGVTAACAAAASLGAPFQNGFAAVSLSDLLTPTEEVRANLKAVARSALPVALYNPAGRERRALLSEALAVFKEARGDVLSAFVRNAGREDERKWTGPLSELPVDEVDMSTLVVVGGPRTRADGGAMYEPRGYAEKYGTGTK